MKLGSFVIEQLSEGQFQAFRDGTINRKPIEPGSKISRNSFAYGHNSRLSIDPVYITDGTSHILVDTGLGWGLDAGSAYQDISNVKTNLDIFGCGPADITHVILTHLHYDHAAGTSYTDDRTQTCPTFPNARFYVQQREWDYALQQVGVASNEQEIGYRLDDFYRLVADSRVEFIDDDFVDLISGIKLIWTGGHTPGHQIVRIESEKQSAYYLGDLVPNESHLNRYTMRSADIDPLQAKKMKIQLLRSAYDQESVLLFYHSLFQKAGRLIQDERKKYVLRDL